MKIKNFEEFVNDYNTNEKIKIKDLASGTLIAANMLLPNNSYGSDKIGDTLHKKTHSSDEMNRLVKYNGWSLDKTIVDTIWTEVIKKEPKKLYHKTELEFNIDGDLFISGEFKLKDDVNANIKEEINFILNMGDNSSKNVVLKNITIESSTDREPIKYGNKLLASKRANVVKDELINIGVNDTIIDIILKPEQGPDIFKKDIKDVNRDSLRFTTREFRYVKITISYIIIELEDYPGLVERIPNIKKTYLLSKNIDKQNIKKPKNIKKHFKKTTSSFEIKTNKKRGNTKCYDFNSDGFWNKSNIGYE